MPLKAVTGQLRRHLPPLAFAAVLLGLPLSGQAGEGPPPTIAIIIDDMGVHKEPEQRLIRLDQPLTLAFLPHRRHTSRLAEYGHLRNKEIMLHAPMANMARIGLGPGGLDVDMDEREIASTLREALESVPNVAGVNNHMGSLLTQQEEPMEWVMDEVARHELYFIDSRTSAGTVAAETAESRDIPTMSRDVFLDNKRTRDAIDAQFQHLLDQAREHGTAIAIGHPYEVTVSYLEDKLPELDEKGIAVATVSAVWRMRNNNLEMFDTAPSDHRRLVQLEDD